ncbi:MAG TPA: RNA 2',3'-cyclic phosphodiesterase [Clostridiales bacterium]|nr:RNA 2',3'-cyclic phosphodiesterase [Clostridiales bacterium]
MRAFVAILLPTEIRKNIASFYGDLGIVKGIKGVPWENLHITLNFLGEIEEEGVELSALCQNLATAATGMQPFTMELKGVGAFPSLAAPKTLWVAMEKKKALFDLAKAVKAASPGNAQKPFSPHLTVGRVKYEDPSQERFYREFEFKKREAYSFGHFRVSSFFLMKSDLTGKTPVYTVVEEFKIKDGEKLNGSR